MSEKNEKTDIIVSKEETKNNSEQVEIKEEIPRTNEEKQVENIETKVEVNENKNEQKEIKEENETKKEEEKNENEDEEDDEENEEEEDEKVENKINTNEIKKEEEKNEINSPNNKNNEEINTEIKHDNKKEDTNDDKTEDKKEEEKEVKEEKEETKKDEDDEIKIIKKKKTLKQSDSDLLKENEEENEKENIKENKDSQKKENEIEKEKETKPSEEKKITNLTTSTRKRYTFRSDNKFLNSNENPQKNIINEKKNHQIYISIVPNTSKKEQVTSKVNIIQPKNLSKDLNLVNKNNTPSEQKKSFNKNQVNDKNQKTPNNIIQKNYQQKKFEISKPIVINNNTNNNKPKEKESVQKIKNNTIVSISQYKTKNLNESKPQAQVPSKNQNKQVISNKRIFSPHVSQNIKPKEIKIENKYIKSPQNPKVPLNKENTTKIISVNTTNKRMTSNYLTNSNQTIKNETKKIENKYIPKKVEPPTPELRDKANKKIYPRIKIDISKYNTEKKSVNIMNRLFAYNSKTVDNRKKETKKLKYYEKCPNCGYHLNDS